MPQHNAMLYNEFALARKRVRKLGNAERRALYRWFKHVHVSDLLRMALRHGGRYLVINGGRCE